MWEALALLVLVLGGLLWADSLKARERAVKAGRSACERQGPDVHLQRYRADPGSLDPPSCARNLHTGLENVRLERLVADDLGVDAALAGPAMEGLVTHVSIRTPLAG